MALYREDSTGFLCEFATHPGAGYTAVSAMPTDTLANRVNWYRTIDLHDLASDWHPSLQGGSEVAAPPGISGTGVNIMAWRYSSFEEPDGLPSLVLTHVTAARNAVGYNGQYRLSLTATANNGTAYLTPLSNVYNIKLTQNLRWIVSLYCSPNTSGEKTFSCLVKTANSGTVYELPFTTGATAGQWTRVYAELDLRADTSVGAMLGFKIASSGVRIDVDAIMIEELIGGVAAPSAYYAPISYIDGAQIVNGSITGTEIASATITASEIANLTITASQIANLTLTGSKIADATIDNAKISDLSANKLTAGTIDANTITVINLSATNITGGTLSVNRIAANSISGAKLTIGGVTTDNVASNAITYAISTNSPTEYSLLPTASWTNIWSITIPSVTANRGRIHYSVILNLSIPPVASATTVQMQIKVNNSVVRLAGHTAFASSSNQYASFCISHTDVSFSNSSIAFDLELYTPLAGTYWMGNGWVLETKR